MRILIVGPAWVGDMVMAQTLFICLKQQHPNAVIDVLAPQWCRELLTRMPEVNEALPLPIGHGELALGKRREIARQLRGKHYTQAIVLPNSFKSALIPRFAGIPLRTGWRGEARSWLLNDCRILNKEAYPLMVQRFAALAYPPGAQLQRPLPRPALQVKPEHVRQLRERLQLTSDKKVLVLCPGAEFGPAKQWPVEHYTAVARHYLVEQGMQVWLMGSDKDRATADTIVAGVGQSESIHNLCGSTRLGEAVDLLSAATAVVSNDSGLMHVTAALARPLVVVYGSTSAAFTPPLAERVRCLSLQLSCSPCFKRECPLTHLNCLRQLGPERVITALNELVA